MVSLLISSLPAPFVPLCLSSRCQRESSDDFYPLEASANPQIAQRVGTGLWDCLYLGRLQAWRESGGEGCGRACHQVERHSKDVVSGKADAWPYLSTGPGLMLQLLFIGACFVQRLHLRPCGCATSSRVQLTWGTKDSSFVFISISFSLYLMTILLSVYQCLFPSPSLFLHWSVRTLIIVYIYIVHAIAVCSDVLWCNCNGVFVSYKHFRFKQTFCFTQTKGRDPKVSHWML